MKMFIAWSIFSPAEINSKRSEAIRGDDHHAPVNSHLQGTRRTPTPIRESPHDSGVGQNPAQQAARSHESAGLPENGIPAPCTGSNMKKGNDKFLKKGVDELLDSLADTLSEIPRFDQETLEQIFVSFLEENEIKLRKLAQPLPIDLTGKTASPGIFEIMQVLGKEKVVNRILKAVDHINAK
jgi:Anticodon binding domain